ncbi:MAG: HEAT repeat domain-containing protein [Sedimentisphaerales bacterium]|nr:HEAT repeat domain-containing protein [Sedimentisphaerales bacterium]
MTTILTIFVCALALSTPADLEQKDMKAEEIVRRYLKMPHPENDRFGKSRIERLRILDELKSVPEYAIAAIGKILPKVEDPRQRIELAETLGKNLQTKQSAQLLCNLLKDPDDKVRWQAIHSLRLLAGCTDRIGAGRMQIIPDIRSRVEKEKTAREAIQQRQFPRARQRIQPQDERLEDFVEFAPKVEGLVPYLVSAANDPIESNRICALYALADTRTPQAVAELRNRLKDPSEKVRFYAACFLTEYQDTSGFTEMQDALARLRRSRPEDMLDYYDQIARLLASFERITGKSFGEIPMSPYLSSNTRQIEQIKNEYNTLLQTWAEWWAWEPKSEQ